MINRSAFFASLLILFGFALDAVAQDRSIPPAGADARVEIVAARPDGLTLRVTGLRPVLSEHEGRGVVGHNLPTHLFRLSPDALPEILFTVGVPPGVDRVTGTVSAEGDAIFPIAGSATSLPASPSGTLAINRGGEIRRINTFVVRYAPFSRKENGIAYEESITIDLSWGATVDPEKLGRGVIPEHPVVAADLAARIVNYDQARNWAFSRKANGARLMAGSGWGIGGEAAVVLVPEDGVYRITAAELRGISGLTASVADLRLTNRRRQVPLFVRDVDGGGTFDGSDWIEFRGERNPGEEGRYWSEYTDTNAYILTWRGGEGNPPAAASEGVLNVSTVLPSYDSTLHFEQETYYFDGLTFPEQLGGHQLTAMKPEKVSHERYYWRSGRNAYEQPLEFYCSPETGNGKKVTMRIALAGLTFWAESGLSPNQQLDLWINDVPLPRISIKDTADTVVEMEFPAAYLINGKNRLTLLLERHTGTPIINDVGIDWIEIDGTWLPEARGSALTLPAGAAGTGLRVAGFTERPERIAGDGASAAVDSLKQGHLFRLTSRFDPGLRAHAGFHAVIGAEQVASPSGFAFGITLIEVEPSAAGGRIVRQGHFRTDQDLAEFDNAAAFLRGVRTNNIVIAGLAYGTNRDNPILPASFRSEMEALGSRAVSTENFFVAGWAFAARKGTPSTAVERFSRSGDVTLNAFIPDDANGSVWSAVVPLAAGNSTVGTLESPAMRRHDEDQLVRSDNSADLLIITHPAFADQAERLAEHRASHEGYSVDVIDVNRIYDEFNDGIKHPEAIRRFLQFADSNWTEPTPAFVLLLGDASYDPMRRMAQSVMIDYVPTYGYPASDYLFTVAYDDPTYTPKQYIGRVPAMNRTDADVVIDKLIEYDGQAPARWNKRFVFVTGGDRIDQRDEFRAEAMEFGAHYIAGNPEFQGDTTVVSRTGKTDDELRYPTTQDAAKVREEINKGTLWFDFKGHGSTSVLDLDFGYPEDFDNGDRYFVLATWSCQTGLFSFPSEALRNERFVTIGGKGGIAAIGGTSSSFTDIDWRIRDHLYGALTDYPYNRVLGGLLTDAKFSMFSAISGGGFGIDSARYRNHLTMYSLLGDPSMRLAVRPTTELAFPVESASVLGDRNDEPVFGDTSLTVSADLWNYGKPVGIGSDDSVVVVRVAIVAPDGEEVVRYDTLRYPGRRTPVTYRFEAPTEPGNYLVRIEADPDNAIEESEKRDNVIVIPIELRGNQLVLLEPLNYGVEKDASLTIRLLNPKVGGGARFVLDSVPTLDSQSKITSDAAGTVRGHELTTEWEVTIPEGLRSATALWWKAVSTAGNPDDAEAQATYGSFSIAPTSPEDVRIVGADQFGTTRTTGLLVEERGVRPGTRRVGLKVEAVGQTYVDTLNVTPLAGRPLSISIDNFEYRPSQRPGLNVMVLPERGIVPKYDTVFVFYFDPGGNPNNLDAFEDFVENRIVPGERVIVATSGESFNVDDGFPNGNERLRNVLRSLGAQAVDQLALRDSYVLLGGKGLAPGAAKEVWLDDSQLRRENKVPPFTAILRDSLDAIPGSGTWTSPVIGPAIAWNRVELVLDPSAPPVRGTVLGVRRDGMRDPLVIRDVSAADGTIDLSVVDVTRYPRIEVVASFIADTTQLLQGFRVVFEPSPELAFVPSTVVVSPDSVLQGEPVTVEATVANLTSFNPAIDVPVILLSLDETRVGAIDSARIAQIAPLDSHRVRLAVGTERTTRDLAMELYVNPFDRPAEPYVQNNRYTPPPLKVTTDDIPPGLGLYADGNRLLQNDFVAPTAEFEVRLFDNSSLALDSAASITLILDNQWITPRDSGRYEPGTGETRGRLFFKPSAPLAEGEHDALVFVRDASGNGDTSEIITFVVEGEASVRNVVNYPNPFDRETSFTFVLTGVQRPESGEIAVFTPTGRKIKSIDLDPESLHIGFNRVDWDGRDADGDQLANGVYVYRLSLDVGEETVQSIEKLVILR